MAAVAGFMLLICGVQAGAAAQLAAPSTKAEDAAPAAIPGAKHAASERSSGPFVGRLPQGTVQLVGITEYPPRKQSRWFQPDGSPAEVPPVLAPQSMLWTWGRPALSFLVLTRSLPRDGSPYPIWEISQHQGAEGQAVVDASGRRLREYRILSAIFPPTLAAVNLRVGYGLGRWDTVVTLKPEVGSSGSFARDGKQRKATLQQVKEPELSMRNATQVTLNCTVNHPEWELRLVAVDQERKEHASRLGSVGKSYIAFFQALPLSSIKEFRLQLRPYSWVEFKNVSLHRGRKTKVEVTPPAFEP